MGKVRRRNKLDIMISLLELLNEPKRLTRLQTDARLNYKNMKEYINLLLRLGFIEDKNSLYKTTDKGREFIRLLSIDERLDRDRYITRIK